MIISQAQVSLSKSLFRALRYPNIIILLPLIIVFSLSYPLIIHHINVLTNYTNYWYTTIPQTSQPVSHITLHKVLLISHPSIQVSEISSTFVDNLLQSLESSDLELSCSSLSNPYSSKPSLITSISIFASSSISHSSLSNVISSAVYSALPALMRHNVSYTQSSGYLLPNPKASVILKEFSNFDGFILSVSYISTIAYVLLCLPKLKAVRSKNGLLFAFVTEILLSTSAALSISYFVIDHHLTMTMPYIVFPLPGFIIGVEHMFRLINAVSELPSEKPAAYRVSRGYIQTLPKTLTALAIDSAVTLITYMLVKTRPTKQFCILVELTILIDFFLHSTFFLGTLAVDLRRVELQDLLDSSWYKSTFRKVHSNHILLTLYKSASLPFSTTWVGSAILFLILCGIEVHYFSFSAPQPVLDSSSVVVFTEFIENYLSWNVQNQQQLTPPDIMAQIMDKLGYSHGELNIQEYPQTVIGLYSPEDQMDLNDIARAVSQRCSISVFTVLRYISALVFLSSTISLILRYLLRKHHTEADVQFDDNERIDSSLENFHWKSLSGYHSLDVVKLSSSAVGTIASLGLDKRLAYWVVPSNAKILAPPTVSHLSSQIWPVVQFKVSSDGRYLCITSMRGAIAVFDFQVESMIWKTENPEISKNQLVGLFFSTSNGGILNNSDTNPVLSLVALNTSGILFEYNVVDGSLTNHYQIHDGGVVAAAHFETPRVFERIVIMTSDRDLRIVSHYHNAWYSNEVELYRPFAKPNGIDDYPPYKLMNVPGEANSLIALPLLGIVVTAQGRNAQIFDIQSGALLKSVDIRTFTPGSMKAFHAKPTHCTFCGSFSIKSLSIAYTCRGSRTVYMHTLTMGNKAKAAICLRVERDPHEKRCLGFDHSEESLSSIENVECWAPTDSNMLIGLKDKPKSHADSDVSTTGSSLKHNDASNLNLRRHARRLSFDTKGSLTKADDRNDINNVSQFWEGWTIGPSSELWTYEVEEKSTCSVSKVGKATRKGQLLVGNIQCYEKFGHRSLAVGYGNSVRIFYFGRDEVLRGDISSPVESRFRGVNKEFNET
ncbi:hypothetical protein CANCADRAFT_3671 [Tortispora caseinolytica NRRL Y-17796]|uniref:Sterol regulatory element-binding protein cleavage-activating protein n=1 Tax=Tortispora caseinolytica NRRL Y-17796 TaxID=767744 RepID=A0A1E4TBB8_9ASCO|nr:hypothetical protein CANCADRAFT_3671 [Tortispora caseinolytica NRRL Y-17796]